MKQKNQWITEWMIYFSMFWNFIKIYLNIYFIHFTNLSTMLLHYSIVPKLRFHKENLILYRWSWVIRIYLKKIKVLWIKWICMYLALMLHTIQSLTKPISLILPPIFSLGFFSDLAVEKSCFLGPTIFKIPQPNWH